MSFTSLHTFNSVLEGHPRWTRRQFGFACGWFCCGLLTSLAGAAPDAFRPAQAPAQRVYRLLAIGDSITEGSRSFSCYRYPLWEKLFAAGYLVEYVGSRTSDSRIGPLAHEGYSGRNAEYIAATIGPRCREMAPDIVLLHAGHNHTSEEKPVPGILAATERLIGALRQANPHVTILLAQVIPSGKLPKYAYLPELNRELALLAGRLNTPSQPVRLVNQADGFDWTTDTVEDKVHPNARGAEKMAQRWFDALVPVLEPPVPSFHPRLITYKQIGNTELKLHLFSPALRDSASGSARPAPAIVFFFGGGWTHGTPLQFYPECAYFAARGLVAISADYRIASVQHTTPFESVADGKSAIRWVRQHAAELGIDPQRIVAAGASAGGHVAAATGTLPGLDEPSEAKEISSRPNALALWYPVVDNSPGGYGYDRVKERFREISPLHNLTAQTPPTILFLGTKDAAVPVRTATEFKTRLEQAGGRCEVKLFEGGIHPLYSYRKGNSPLRDEILADTTRFLASLGFLNDSTPPPSGNHP